MEIDLIDPNVDIEVLKATVNAYPGMAAGPVTGEPGTCSWYHAGDGQHCTTIFTSDERPTWASRAPGAYVDALRAQLDPKVRLLGPGSYMGVPGTWLLSKSNPELRAPYER